MLSGVIAELDHVGPVGHEELYHNVHGWALFLWPGLLRKVVCQVRANSKLLVIEGRNQEGAKESTCTFA